MAEANRNKKKIPLRMCIACGEMKPKRELIRVVKTKDGDIFADVTGKASGRGAYVCKSADCFAILKKQKKLNRAFSCDVPTEIYDRLCGEIGNDGK